MKITNSVGQTVKVLVNESLPAGDHTKVFSDALPAGVYTYRLKTGNQIQTKRFVYKIVCMNTI